MDFHPKQSNNETTTCFRVLGCEHITAGENINQSLYRYLGKSALSRFNRAFCSRASKVRVPFEITVSPRYPSTSCGGRHLSLHTRPITPVIYARCPFVRIEGTSNALISAPAPPWYAMRVRQSPGARPPGISCHRLDMNSLRASRCKILRFSGGVPG